MADKITFKMETGLKVFMDKEVRDAFEERVLYLIQVEIKNNGEGYATLSEHEFLAAIEEIDDRYNQKYGVDLISDENWYLLKRYPREVVISNCVGECHARDFYSMVLEKYIDYVMSIGSEGCALQ